MENQVIIQSIKDDVDNLEARRAEARAIRERCHRDFLFADVVRDMKRKGLVRKLDNIAMPGEDIQPFPRAPPMARTHNPGWILRGRTRNFAQTRAAAANSFYPKNRALHNNLVLSRNLRRHGRAFVGHLAQWNA